MEVDVVVFEAQFVAVCVVGGGGVDEGAAGGLNGGVVRVSVRMSWWVV